MTYLLYDILLHLSIIILLPYFVFKMFWVRKYREGIAERFGFIKGEKLGALGGSPVVWVHAVSVGETKAALPVLKLLKERRPGVRIVFSTVTQTGNRTAEKEGAGLIDALIYFPLDLSWVVKRVVSRLKPKVCVIVEKEVWPNLLRRLKGLDVPVVVINGTISERSFRRFLAFKFFFREVFGMVSLFSARTAEDRERAAAVGVKEDRAVATGNIKFDLKPPSADPSYLDSLKSSIGIDLRDRTIVAGSTHAGEEEIIIRVFSSLVDEFKGLKLIIAPRHPERFQEVEAIIKKSGAPYARRSRGGAAPIVLLDTVGELMNVYSFAAVAFVGGSLVDGIGGHNLLEPAYFGVPVVYGSRLSAYLGMAEMLEAAGGGIRVGDEASFKAALKRLLSDDRFRASAGASARRVVEANRGAAVRTVAIIERFLG
ncbi:MAG: 3-deoxy-D-manno-octulosonic acid transferase [Deltaproteobacteria bacterium]|nr:3-deoxy-D-manno-octulosonic acid transferase [Deltaproteobacteria bacterium]